MGHYHSQNASSETESRQSTRAGEKSPNGLILQRSKRRGLSSRSRRGKSRASDSRPGPILATGSAIFIFDSALNRPRITAYFIVVFQEEGSTVDLRTQEENSRVMQDPSSSFQLATETKPQQEIKEKRSSAREPMMVDLGTDAQNVTQLEEPPNMGWCRITEEPTDD